MDLVEKLAVRSSALQITTSGERNRPLDGLRGIAIGLVLIGHFWGPVPFLGGHTGVRLFFVLSGFLITGILLQCRDAAERGDALSGTLLLAFYARRCLRIFPPYYLLLAVIGIFDINQVRSTIWWHASYTSNVLAAIEGDFDSITAHHWTLSIEEQFYLFWPLAVLFIPRSKLSFAAWGLIVVGIFSRPLALWLNINYIALYTNPLASLDALGVGALLAIAGHGPFLSKVTRWSLLLCLVVAAVVIVNDISEKHIFWFLYVVYETMFAFALAGIVWHSATSGSRWVSRILSQSALVYVGRISYGLYLYHLLIQFLAVNAMLQMGLISVHKGPLTAIILAVLSVGTAALSWHYFELPIQSAKRLFPYGSKRSPVSEPVIASDSTKIGVSAG
jgi:peptidoglycan/LPS O-acetylase OafA/YrhL